MGDDDRRAAKPAAKNPFFDDEDAPLPVRARKAKPAPSMMTAGGVDMARAHASGIQVREAMPDQPIEEAKVVVAVETDPRKVPTHKRLLEGREARADGTREAMLPGEGGPNPWSSTAGAAVDRAASPSATAATPVPGVAAKNPQGAGWTRIALVLVVLLLAAGVVRRASLYLAEEPAPPPVVAAPPPPVEPAPLPTAAAAKTIERAETAAPVPEAPRPIATTAEPTATAAPRPVRAPPPPRPTFQPPFELPREKNK
jgi:hypothetical protein